MSSTVRKRNKLHDESQEEMTRLNREETKHDMQDEIVSSLSLIWLQEIIFNSPYHQFFIVFKC